jgi:hypothetical protein
MSIQRQADIHLRLACIMVDACCYDQAIDQCLTAFDLMLLEHDLDRCEQILTAIEAINDERKRNGQ